MEKEYLLEYKKKLAKLSSKEKELRDAYLRNLSLGVLNGPLVGNASVDKPWLKYYPPVACDLDMNMSMFQLLKYANRDNLDAVSMRYNDFKITFKKYIDNIEKCAKSLKALNTEKKEIVLLILPNVPECRTLIYACNILGAISYPINPMLPYKDLEKIFENNFVKTVFIYEGFWEKFSKIIDNSLIKNIILTTGRESIPQPIQFFLNFKDDIKNADFKKVYNHKKVLSWQDFFKLHYTVKEEIVPYYKPNETAVIIGTSGTTGVPKGVCLTNENANAMTIQHLISDMNFKKGDVFLDILIQSISYGFTVAHYSGVLGVQSVMIPNLVYDFSDLLKKYKPDHCTAGPVHYDIYAKKCQELQQNPQYTKNMVSGGATLPPKTEEYLNGVVNGQVPDESKIFVRQGFGCTENGGVATYAKLGTYKYRGLGIPLRLENLGIFKPGTEEELEYNELGEIAISGPTVMKEYLRNEVETAEVLKKHSDGSIWLHIQDLGYVDTDGQFFMTDKIKDIFMRSGFNVHPSKIETYICENFNVVACKVVGVSHPVQQMVPVAFIEPQKGENIEQLKKLIENGCYKNLEEYSIPYEIFFVEQMPRNLGGKIMAAALLKDYSVDYTNHAEELVLNKVKN